MNPVLSSRRKGNRGRGAAGKAPVSGDWDNNGISEIGVFRLFNAPVLSGLQWK
jgi:hypothetical protein